MLLPVLGNKPERFSAPAERLRAGNPVTQPKRISQNRVLISASLKSLTGNSGLGARKTSYARQLFFRDAGRLGPHFSFRKSTVGSFCRHQGNGGRNQYSEGSRVLEPHRRTRQEL